MPSGTYQKNSRDVLKREKEYYENNKERLEEQEINKYRELYNEEKNIKLEYIRNRYQNMSREDKRRLKNYHEAKKKKHKTFLFFFFAYHRNEYKILFFGQNNINKNLFHKCKHLINIDKADIRNIVVKISLVKKVYLNTLFGTEVMLIG